MKKIICIYIILIIWNGYWYTTAYMDDRYETVFLSILFKNKKILIQMLM